MNYKALCAGLSTVLLLTSAGCGKKPAAIAGKYEASIPVTGSNSALGIREFDSSLPVYLTVGKDNTFSIDLGFKELKRDLNSVADSIERGGVLVVKDVTVTGSDHYEGTYEYKEGQFVFSGDVDFIVTVEDDTLLAESLFGEKTIKFS